MGQFGEQVGPQQLAIAVVPDYGRLVLGGGDGDVGTAGAVAEHDGGDGAAVGGEGVEGRAGGIGGEGEDLREGPDVDHGVGGAGQEEAGGRVDGERGDGLEVRGGGGHHAAGGYL